MSAPARGEVWLADLDPTQGHEQTGRRPVLIVSDDIFNRGPARLVIALPMTSVLKSIPSHVRVLPPEGGLQRPTAILCEAVRSISTSRLLRRWGTVSTGTLSQVEDALRVLLKL